jgi:hypothetical protein
MQLAAPVKVTYLPVRQAIQFAALLEPVAVMYLPAMQSMQSLEPFTSM